IETDKATMEYEAVDEGTLAKIVVPEGTQDVAVNSVIAVLAGEGEDVKAAAGAAKAAPAKAPEKKSEAPPAAPKPQRQDASPQALHLPPQARRQKRPRKPNKLLTAIVFFPLRWRVAWPKRPASISATYRARVRMAASLRVMSTPQSQAKDCVRRPVARRREPQ